MRRPPVACQRAVQSLQLSAPQYISVPDNILSLAVHQFFPSIHPQQKRHGSNVPGPLEARRRADKRRMTASTGFSPQDSFPTSFSLGALFGYRSNPQNSWRYEPPSLLPKDTPPPDTPLSTWDDTHLVELQPRTQANDLSPISRDLPYPFVQQLAAQGSTEARNQNVDLEAVSPKPSQSRNIESALASDIEFEKCLRSFKARIATAGDNHNELLMKESFRQCLPTATFLWRYHFAALQHTLQLGCSSSPVLECLLQNDGRLLRSVDPLQGVDESARFLDCLESLESISTAKHTREKTLVRQIYRIIAQSAAQANCSTTEAQDAVLLRLIKHTEHSTSSGRSKEPASVKQLLCALAANLRKTADNELLLLHLAQSAHAKRVITSTVHTVAASPDRFASAERALFYMPRPHLLAQVPTITLSIAYKVKDRLDSTKSVQSRHMDTWLQLLQHVDAKAGTDKALLDAALTSLARNMLSYKKRNVVSPRTLVEAMLLRQNLDIGMPPTISKPRRFHELFVDVLLQMQAQPMVYSSFLDMGLGLIARCVGLDMLLRCIRTMEQQKLPLSTNTNFEALITKELDTLHNPTGNLSESQLQSRAFKLQACEKLIKVLGRMGYALPAKMEEAAGLSGTRQFDHLLSRAKANNALPIAYRNATKELSLMERVAVIHQLAYHYSQDTTRTQREVWRSIYYLYKHLHYNSLPIGPLFTKAVVHSSITRPLTENRFVSARRLIWVCHLVARAEGDKVAAQVENHFYTWRGDLIGRAKRIYVGLGGSKQSKAHVGTMKRLGLI